MTSKGPIGITLYAAALAVFAALMTWAKYRFLFLDNAPEWYGLIVGLIFVVVGIWIGLKLAKPKTLIQKETIVRTETVIREVALPAKESPEEVAKLLARLNISQREYEVLQFLAGGLSNGEIAERMYLSQNTIKTHLSNLYTKLDAKRRTQAVEKARSLGLV